MEPYLEERSNLFNAGSEFSCPEPCERYGCKEPDLHVSISLVDLVSISWTSGEKVSYVFKRFCKLGFDPVRDGDPWLGRLSLELKKPCLFLKGKACAIYRGRPVSCALFPEAFFLSEEWASALRKDVFRNFPCVQAPCSLSPRRREVLRQLMATSASETFLSDFFLFGISPFLIDLQNVAGEGLEGIPLSDDGKARVPHQRIEMLVTERLFGGDTRKEWEGKIEQLDHREALARFAEMKKWTDEMLIRTKQGGPAVAHRFEGKHLVANPLRK